MSFDQLRIDQDITQELCLVPTAEQLLALPDTAYEQMKLFCADAIWEIWKSPLEKKALIPLPHSIGTADEDRSRFSALDSPNKRRDYLFDIYKEVGRARCMRDTRLIYDIELPIMSRLLGVTVDTLQSWETPEKAQDPDTIVDEGGLCLDVMRLFVILDELGYNSLEVKKIISRDIEDIGPFIQRGGYYKFIDAVADYLPYRFK